MLNVTCCSVPAGNLPAKPPCTFRCCDVLCFDDRIGSSMIVMMMLLTVVLMLSVQASGLAVNDDYRKGAEEREAGEGGSLAAGGTSLGYSTVRRKAASTAAAVAVAKGPEKIFDFRD